MTDDLRGAVPASVRAAVGGPTFVLCTLVYSIPGWAAVCRYTSRAKLDGLAAQLQPLTHQPFTVIEVACHLDDVEAIELAVSKIPVVNTDGILDLPWSSERHPNG